MAGSSDRNTKRSQLGNRVQRGIWKSAHAWKHPWYESLCRRVEKINSHTMSTKVEAKLDKTAQARIFAQHAVDQRTALAAWGL